MALSGQLHPAGLNAPAALLGLLLCGCVSHSQDGVYESWHVNAENRGIEINNGGQPLRAAPLNHLPWRAVQFSVQNRTSPDQTRGLELVQLPSGRVVLDVPEIPVTGTQQLARFSPGLYEARDPHNSQVHLSMFVDPLPVIGAQTAKVCVGQTSAFVGERRGTACRATLVDDERPHIDVVVPAASLAGVPPGQTARLELTTWNRTTTGWEFNTWRHDSTNNFVESFLVVVDSVQK